MAPQPAPPSLAARLERDGPFTEQLAPGLVVSALVPPEIADAAFSRPPLAEVATTDRRLFVVTIDPARFELRYHSVLEAEGPRAMDAEAWADREGLVVAWNPGMFEPDHRATGYTRAGAFASQASVRRNGLYRSWFVVAPGGGPAAVLDQVPPKGQGTYGALEELPAPFRERIAGADLVVQSLPILRGGAPAYPPRKNQWSELCYGVDRQGRVVVVFSRYPYEMRELGARLAALGIALDGLLHGEGGPEASLVVRVGGETWARMGSYETGFSGDDNRRLWALPSVLGAAPRPPSP
jgi:hypothetical protein